MKKNFKRTLAKVMAVALTVSMVGVASDDVDAAASATPAASAPASTAPAASAPATNAPASNAPASEAPTTNAPEESQKPDVKEASKVMIDPSTQSGFIKADYYKDAVFYKEGAKITVYSIEFTDDYVADEYHRCSKDWWTCQSINHNEYLWTSFYRYGRTR